MGISRPAGINNLGTSSASLTLDVIIPLGQSQTVALYLLDYDQKGRSESVSVTDTSNNSLDGPHAVNNFTNGEYLTWTISEEVHINITLVNGPNAVASGISFGQSTVMPPPLTAGAYITEKILNPLASDSITDIAKLTLPSGTYLLSASIFAQLSTPTSSGLVYECYLSHTKVIQDDRLTSGPQGDIKAGQPNTGEQHISTTIQATYTTTGTDTIILTCGTASDADILIDGVLTALAIPSVNKQ